MIHSGKRFQQSIIVTASIITITTFLLLAAWWITTTLTFFTVDTGLRFIQVQEIIRQGWTTLAVDYPGRVYDPDLQHTPFYYAYLLVDEQIFLNITPFLPFLAAVLYSQIGSIGLLLLPVAGGVFIALALYKLGTVCGLRHRLLLLWAAVFATPVVFYSLTFWDHTIGTALLLWGTYFWVYGLMDQTESSPAHIWLMGGVCFGLSLGQRPEAYLYVTAAGLALLLFSWRQWQAIMWAVAGGFVGAAPIWISQTVWFGHPLGPVVASTLTHFGHVESYPVSSYIEFPDGIPLSLKIGRLLFYVESGDPVTFIALFAMLCGLALVVLQLRLRPVAPQLLPALVLLLVAYLIWLREAWQQPIPGLITTFPLIPLSLTYIDDQHVTTRHKKAYRFILLTLFLFLGLALRYMSFGGGQWGARYLLPAYPLLLFLAFYVFEHYSQQIGAKARPHLQLLFATLVIMSVVIQAAGLRTLWYKHENEAEIQHLVAALPVEWILTSDPFLPSFMSALDDKSFLFVNDQAGLARLVPRLAEDDITCFALIESSPFPLTVPEQIEGIALIQVTPAVYAMVPSAMEMLLERLTAAYCDS
jgi:hypothetical protein